jgi:hypothetical protein
MTHIFIAKLYLSICGSIDYADTDAVRIMILLEKIDDAVFW